MGIRLEQKTFRSRSLKRDMDYRVLLPAGYDASKKNVYPVIFLLHGLTGHFSNWTDKTDLESIAEKYPFVIITPEANDSWYIDSQVKPQDKYESYLQEMIRDARKRYRPSHLIIAGLSMGGYGAIKFALKNPDEFWMVGSFSGAFRIDKWGDMGGPNHLIGQSIEDVFGPVDSDARKKNDIYRLLKDLPAKKVRQLPFMYISCGKEDTTMLKPNNDFVDTLREKNVPSDKYLYDNTQAGGHDWKFWGREVEGFLDLVNQRLAKKPQ